MTTTDEATTTVTVLDEATTASSVAGALGVPAGLTARWDLASGFQHRSLHVVRAGGRVAGVAFAVHRPLTAYEKVAGLWTAPAHDDAATAAGLLASVVSAARAAGAVVVKVELDPRAVADTALVADAARAAGFADLPAPVGGAAHPVGPHDVPAGLARWLDDAPAPVPVPYYRQTTELTCGPVAVGVVMAAAGDDDALGRDAELTLYREANTLVGSDPFGLAVAAAARGHRPRVLVTTPDPVLLEGVTTDWERDTRSFIQRGFRERALAAGLDVETRDFGIDEIVAHVAAGGHAVVLIDEHPMHVDVCPHWITVHAVRGDVVVAHDPWTDNHLGESWLDGADLALPRATLDRLAAYGDPAYRAALLFG
ncbi:conserved hypothetical protein [Xylanimonas cellulosilytica DSM 15894]|uniref:GCN5-related N-acetyltransferase n=1 Tax=Xylanimonas cellulosilytica (strain DSM 15894 / JCM 12276 / CECT 5975 / KCTC 9989 / LMG 20990 / NBRC 107835 / XIL07) TaxID=446471 RepID=D1C0G3_XYLCX|nr:peptidase C39 family protein [Xylanimonas cellulosilytica]ACZ32166.1 conserved hypothetical protein [Xylanimonas cellulosilytica DSM 15894]